MASNWSYRQNLFKSRVPFYYSTYAKCKVTQSFPFLIMFEPLMMRKSKIHSSIEQEQGLKSKVLLDIIEGFDIYSSFISVRKFKFCVSAIVKRYQGLLRASEPNPSELNRLLLHYLNSSLVTEILRVHVYSLSVMTRLKSTLYLLFQCLVQHL